MSTTDDTSDQPDAGAASDADPDALELAAQNELLVEENRRLRAEYVRARKATHRRTAAGLAGVGLLATLGGLIFPDGRAVLFTLAAIGLFGGVLTYYLTPGRFVAADVGERVYAALAANETAIATELGLRNDHIYLPGSEATPARLFVPQRAGSDPPEGETPVIVTDDDHRGLALKATGDSLFREFERALAGDLATSPEPLVGQLVDGLVHQFELVAGADPDVQVADGRITVAVVDSAFGAVNRFDHPVPSFLAVGVATGLEQPVEVTVEPADERADWLITCRWEPEPTEIGDQVADSTERTQSGAADTDEAARTP